MTYEEAEALVSLVNGWAQDGSPLTLTCAQDVFGEIQEFPVSDEINVQVIPHYEPGQWKLTRHDACDVTGGYTIEDAVIISHKNCTVLARNDG